MSLDLRNARFLRAVESSRWYRGRPEQIWIGIQEHKGTLLLELAKGLRVTEGRTSRGITKPHRYKQTTRALCYNLADQEHLQAFLTTFSRMTAMAAAIEKRPAKNGMEYGQRKLLGQTPVQLRSTLDGTTASGYEVLELACENANFRSPSNRLFARNPKVRAAEWERRRRQCWLKKQYTFYIRRVVNDQRGTTINQCSELSVPLERVAKIAQATEGLLRESWSYLVRHRDQVERRYDHPKRTRWQLHHPPAFDWLLPRLDSALAYQEESALFEQPELYRHVPRLLSTPNLDAKTPTLGDYHPLYVRRLLAYADGELLWRRNWSITELQALDDLVHIKELLSDAMKLKLRELILTHLVLMVMRKRRQRCPSNFAIPRSFNDCWSAECKVHHPPRGPPL